MSAEEALEALEAVTSRLREGRDPRAAFPEIYGIITREVARTVEENRGIFLEPAWLSRLAGRFCTRYLETLARSLEGLPQDSGAWTTSYKYDGLRATVPIQAAALGLSAHINYDLALGIFENIVAFGHGRDQRMIARYKHDHDAVNSLLQASIPEAFERMVHRHGCALSAVLYRPSGSVLERLIIEVLARWRARVWREVVALLDAEGTDAYEAIVQRMERRSTRICQIFAAPSAVYVTLRGAARPQVAEAILEGAPM